MTTSEAIPRQNPLATRIGPRARVFTAKLLRAAESALAQISSMCGFWLMDDVNKLDGALHKGGAGFSHYDIASIQALIRQLQKSTEAFGFPAVSRLALSLERLFEGGGADHQPPAGLVSSHMLAIKAASRAERGVDDPVAIATCEELEAQTRAYLGAPKYAR